MIKMSNYSVLIVVDVQRDFCAGGALAVPDGDAVVPVINELAKRFENVIITQDWHPRDHISFASQYPGSKPFEKMLLSYGEQVLWPDHCVQGTPGAELHPDLDIPHAQLILRKGGDRFIDSYSALLNANKCSTGLAGYLRDREYDDVYVVGLAYDYCVAATATDAASFRSMLIPQRRQYSVSVIKNACRAIDQNGSVAKAERDMTAAGVTLVDDLN